MKRSLLVMLLLLLGAVTAFAQFTLKGQVTDPGGEPLPCAHVLLSGTFMGVSTTADGSFVFERLKPGTYSVVASFIGYEEQKETVNLDRDRSLTISLKPAILMTGEVVVTATRAGEKTPMAFTNISKEALQGRNMGQDLPFLLMQTPSLVATSDAGTGIGYTAFRVRGTDMNRMNVTVNGIPLNDAESHSTFFVDQPDLASSAEVIQVQRGAGTSSNGGAAFGATINLQTLTLNPDPYAEFQSAAGSFNTFKNSIAAGTGLLNNRFTLDARLSGIRSDGYVDRAFSNLKSLYLSAGYHSEKSVIKAIFFTGWEETYQSWNGVPSVRLNNDLNGMKLYEEHGLYSTEETAAMIASDSRTYNLYTYKNQIDHYQQDNAQLHFSHRFNKSVNLNAALHYTFGMGYYEQYKANQKFTNYNLPKPVVGENEISRTDLVRRKWLDNDFYGMVISLNYLKNKLDLSLGGGWNHYLGRHFGRIIWGQFLGTITPDYEWYRNRGRKTDFNNYVKANWQLTPDLNCFGDLQLRLINYAIDGIDDDLRSLDHQHRYAFFNPKAGLFYQPSTRHTLYTSFARTHREPNRDNFTDTPPGGNLPEAETLNDLEAGWNYRSSRFTTGINLYYMAYKDQLVLTGQINDVGAPVMTNVNKSYRTGLELLWGLKLLPSLRWDGNATFSRNKIGDFTEYVDDWDTWGQNENHLGTTDLAFSPTVTGNSQLNWNHRNFSLSLVSSYAGKQFIDNSSSEERMLDAWLVNHLKADYTLSTKQIKNIAFHFLISNLFNEEYESNAWVYSYYYEGKRYKMDGYFPQAGRNFMVGINLKF